MAIKTTEQSRQCQTLLTRKRAHSELGWWKCERALECGENSVALEALADVLGAFRADAIGLKTARAKQGAIAAVSPLLTSTRAQCRDLLEVLQD
eukprot:scaffold998_cov146-Isochrysis_galbana.AAC.3